MKRNALILCSLFGALAADAVVATDTGEDRKGRPNIILILTDDQGYNDLGCFGSEKIKTPRIDAMARDGIKLTSFYAGAPLCGPSRASLLTGCYSQRLQEAWGFKTHMPGKKKHYHTVLHSSETLISELLKDAGYATAAIGKWHVSGSGRSVIRVDEEKAGLEQFSLNSIAIDTLPTRKGFDYYYGIPYSNDMTPAALLENETVVEHLGHGEAQRGITTRYTDKALNFIEQNKDKPFFLYLAHNMPHTPLWPAAEFEGNSAYGIYGDCVEEIDWNVGRILDRLKQIGIDDNTMVVFTSDNGPWIEKERDRLSQNSPNPRHQAGTAAPLRGFKMTSWEGGLRVPCVIRMPRKGNAGTVSDELASAIDLFPTFAAMAGAQLPADRKIDGLDLSELLTGKTKQSPRSDFFYYKWTHLHAVRDSKWKLVLPREARPDDLKWYCRLQETIEEVELYDMKGDAGETTSVAHQHPEVVARMMEIVAKAHKDLGDGSRSVIGEGVR